MPNFSHILTHPERTFSKSADQSAKGQMKIEEENTL
jgi:hypothetical protein